MSMPMTVPVVGDPVLPDHNAHGSLDNVSDGGHQVRGQEEPAADAAAVARGGLDAHDAVGDLAVERREGLGSAAAGCGVGIGCRGGGGPLVVAAATGEVFGCGWPCPVLCLARVAAPPKMARLRAIPATRSALRPSSWCSPAQRWPAAADPVRERGQARTLSPEVGLSSEARCRTRRRNAPVSVIVHRIEDRTAGFLLARQAGDLCRPAVGQNGWWGTPRIRPFVLPRRRKPTVVADRRPGDGQDRSCRGVRAASAMGRIRARSRGHERSGPGTTSDSTWTAGLPRGGVLSADRTGFNLGLWLGALPSFSLWH